MFLYNTGYLYHFFNINDKILTQNLLYTFDNNKYWVLHRLFADTTQL